MFEVGKKYVSRKYDKPCTCEYIAKTGYALLTCVNASWVEHQGLFECNGWKEVKPLTFADLAPGDKFKFVDDTRRDVEPFIKVDDLTHIFVSETSWQLWSHAPYKGYFNEKEVARV